MESDVDPIEWSRRRWQEGRQPDAERFAAMAAILRTHQTVCAGLDRALKDYDISRTAYLILSTLYVSRQSSLRLGQISKHLMVHPTTITLAIDQLEKRGLVTRGPDPSDRRTIMATLTKKGTQALEDANRGLADVGYGLDGVTESLAVTLTEILRQVRERLGDS
jgi:DNA-binding MarR family transcriptional regulator